MNELENFDRLCEAARNDAPPAVDVSGKVIEALAERAERRNPWLWAFAGVSSAAALFIAAVAIYIWANAPMAELFDLYVAVLQ